MNANPQTAVNPSPAMAKLFAGWDDHFYAPVGRTVAAPYRPATSVARTLERPPSVEGVRELIAAAGPLTVEDIAGGMDIPVRRASAYVRWMVQHQYLAEDEWQRYRVATASCD